MHGIQRNCVFDRQRHFSGKVQTMQAACNTTSSTYALLVHVPCAAAAAAAAAPSPLLSYLSTQIATAWANRGTSHIAAW
jgi:hypothetical protein